MRRLIYPEVVPVEDLALAGPVGHIRAAEAEELDYEPVETGAILPPRWETYWLRVRADVPQAFAGSRVDLRFDFGGEATIWRGRRLFQGLNGGGFQQRREAVLLDPAAGGERVELLLELACRGGVALGFSGDLAEPGRLTGGGFVLDRCELARFDDEAWQLFHDLVVLQELEREREHGLDPARAGRLLAGLDTFCDRFRAEDRSTWAAARETLGPLLAAGNAAGRAPPDRGGARAPRYGLAVAALGDPAQGAAHLQHPARADGALSGAPLRVLAAAAVRLGQGA